MNLVKRVITSIFLVVAVVLFLFLKKFNNLYFDILIYLFMIIGTYEIVKVIKDKLTIFQKIIIFIFSFSLLPVFVFLNMYFKQYIIFLSIVIISDCIFEHNSVTIENLTMSVFIALYPNLLLLSTTYINHFGDIIISYFALISIFLISSLSDVFAFFIGSWLRGPKLCPEISPNKTISGAVGGLLGGLIGALLLTWIFRWLGYFAEYNQVLFYLFMGFAGILMSFFTQIGDLVESLIKRKLGLKDFGNIFPGHGGMLDRIDGFMFNSSLVYIIFSFLL